MKTTKNHQKNQDKKNEEFPTYREFLRDLKKSGKLRDWDGDETKVHKVSEAYFQIPGLEKYGEKMCTCAKFLDFESCLIIEHGKVLRRANFCGSRMCPMCQRRKASKVRHEVLILARAHLKKYPDDVPILLTLTSPNVYGEYIGQEVDDYMKSFERFIKRKAIKQMNRSWFKSLEITKNHERNDYHPHFHILLMAPPEYFYKDSPTYRTRDELLKLWQESKRDFTITQVDVRVIHEKGEGKLEAIIAEVAKYATKPSSYVYKDENGEVVVDREALEHLHNGLRGRRVIGYGGYFKQVRKEMKLEALEKEAELKAEETNPEENSTPQERKPTRCRECNQEMVPETYVYDIKIKRYVKMIQHDHGPSP